SFFVVDRSAEARPGDIVIMRINNEFTVKRLMVGAGGEPYLHPENSSGLFRDIHPAAEDEWECFGVVRFAIKAF
ncbi:MAG: S24 family peptidase, partial [Duodenibacillus sp.]|nr:S24 family peptidase [Duodenibacillus sp.]